MKKKLISVLIPCYNAERFLDECLSALLNQTYHNLEVIIVNDGSTDNSEKIIDNYIDLFSKRNMRLIKINQKNSGQASACNNGLKYVTGEYLYWQDADDVLELDALEKMYNFLEKNQDYMLVRGKVSFRKEESFDIIEYTGEAKKPLKDNIFDDYLFEKNAYCFVGIFMVRMSYFDKCNPKRELYIAEGGQNYQLLLPVIYKGKCGYIDEFVYKYRIVSNSHSRSVKKIKDLLKRCNVHKDTVNHVLDSISSMPNAVRKKYKIRVAFKYLKRKLQIFIDKIKQLIKRIIGWENNG